MIVKEHTSWMRLLFSIRGSSLAHTWKRMVFVFAVSIFATAYYEYTEINHIPLYSLTPLPFTLIGLAVSIFLGFRNNESYDRFWEGRQLWGRMVNVCRSYARQVLTLANAPADDPEATAACGRFQRDMIFRTIAYQHAFRCQLRGDDPFPNIARFVEENEILPYRRHQNVAVAMLQAMGERLRWAWQQGWIHDFHLPVLEASLTEMTSVQGGCERIKSTPIPYAYTVLIHRIVGFYCLTLPFGIVAEVREMTPLVTLLIAHAFLGLDAIGDEIEEPFGKHANDLPLDSITRTIEINLLEIAGEESVPDPLPSQDGLLL